MKKITNRILRTLFLLSLLTIGTGNLSFAQSDNDEKLTPEELEVLESMDPVEVLKLGIQSANSECPFEIDEGMVCTKIIMENKNVMYYVECDEILFDISTLSDASDSDASELLKAILVEEFNDTKDPDIVLLRNMCKKAGYGIGYCFVGNKSKKKVKAALSAKELK